MMAEPDPRKILAPSMAAAVMARLKARRGNHVEKLLAKLIECSELAYGETRFDVVESVKANIPTPEELEARTLKAIRDCLVKGIDVH